MAISKNYTTGQGVNCTNAYIVVTSVNYNKIPPFMDPNQAPPNTSVNASIFLNKDAKENKLKSLESLNFYFQADPTQSMLPQAYEALKALPDMAGAVDC